MTHLFLTNPDGTRTELPKCSKDWTPSKWWITACLFDGEGPICHNHRNFFTKQKATE